MSAHWKLKAIVTSSLGCLGVGRWGGRFARSTAPGWVLVARLFVPVRAPCRCPCDAGWGGIPGLGEGCQSAARAGAADGQPQCAGRAGVRAWGGGGDLDG